MNLLSAQDACYECLKKCKRDIRLEPIIIKDPGWSYLYATDIIKGRWTEAEHIISTNSEYAYFYAKYVIKGKLPESMHNAMLIHADLYAKEYFDFIKNNTQP
jgi:hypothetical protein